MPNRAGADRLDNAAQLDGVRRCAIHGVLALDEPSRVGGIPHQRKGHRGHVCTH
jgi:hypothetical protein